MPACRPRIEPDPVIRHDLTTIKLRMTRARDLTAEPAFHHASRITLLAIRQRWQAMCSDVGHAGHASIDVQASGALPDKVARVETTMYAVLIENGDEPVNPKLAIQESGSW